MSDSAALPDSLASAKGLYIQPECQPLNSVDRMLGLVDHSLRRLGSPGFETQTLVWLSSRVDLKRLRAALDLLGQHYPAIAGRLVRSQHGVGPYWQFHPSAGGSLEETHLVRDDCQAVLDHAARLLATSADPSEVAPMRFHLLHRPGGKDVLLVQYNHTLLDHGAAQNLLCAVNRLDEAAIPPSAPVRKVWRDPIWSFLQGHNRKQRLRIGANWCRPGNRSFARERFRLIEPRNSRAPLWVSSPAVWIPERPLRFRRQLSGLAAFQVGRWRSLQVLFAS